MLSFLAACAWLAAAEPVPPVPAHVYSNDTPIALVAGEKLAEVSFVAAHCAALQRHFEFALNPKANWFLASKDELNALYLARGSVGGLSTGTYYSSSEGGAYGVWGQNFASGNQGGAIKSGLYSIRPVRAF